MDFCGFCVNVVSTESVLSSQISAVWMKDKKLRSWKWQNKFGSPRSVLVTFTNWTNYQETVTILGIPSNLSQRSRLKTREYSRSCNFCSFFNNDNNNNITGSQLLVRNKFHCYTPIAIFILCRSLCISRGLFRMVFFSLFYKWSKIVSFLLPSFFSCTALFLLSFLHSAEMIVFLVQFTSSYLHSNFS